MKNISFLLMILAILSCKNTSEESNKTEDVEQEVVETKSQVASNYKHSLAQWSLHQPFQDGSLDPMNFADIAKELGFSGLEYVTQLYPQMQTKDGDYQKTIMDWAKEMKTRSDAAGMENVLLMVDRDGELADPDETKRAEAIQVHKYWMDAAALMGAHSVRANLFGELDPEKWHQLSVESLKELGAYGATIGVNIIIENHGGWSSHGEKLVAVMAEVDMNTVGTLPDFGNFCLKREGGERWGAPCIEEYDMYKGIAELMPYAKGVSAKSYNFDENGNETKIDYLKMLQIVNDSGFTGYIGTEYEGPLDDPKEGVALTKNLIQKSLEDLK